MINEGSLGSSIRTVAKNASFLMLSQVITWVLSLILTIFLPRFVGPEGVGQLYLAYSLWTIAGVAIMFGTGALLTKEFAREPEEAKETLAHTLFLQSVLYVVSWLFMMLYVWFVGYQPTTILVIVLIGVSTFFQNIGLTARASLYGLEKMEFVSIADIVGKIVHVGAAVILLLNGQKIVAIAILMTPVAIINATLMVYYLRRLAPVRVAIDLRKIKELLKRSSSYMFNTASLTIYQQVDVVVISLLVNERTIGWYSTADQLFSTLLFIPTIFVTSMFPLFSRLHDQDPQATRQLLRRSFNYLLLVAIPFGLGTVAIAPNIAVLLFGEEFASTGPVLAVMGIVLILMYLTILFGHYAIAVNQQNFWTRLLVIGTVATIPLDLILIPWTSRTFGNGAIGGALAYVITESMMLIIGIRYLAPDLFNRTMILKSAKCLTAGLLMLGAVWPLRNYFIGAPIAVGGITYVTLILLFQVIDPQDRTLIKASGRNLLNRLRPQAKAGNS